MNEKLDLDMLAREAEDLRSFKAWRIVGQEKDLRKAIDDWRAAIAAKEPQS